MDKLGLMNPPTGPPDNSNTFRVQNSYGVTNFGMSSYVNEAYVPGFILPTDVVPGTISFTIQDQVIVWLATNISAGTMMSPDDGNSGAFEARSARPLPPPQQFRSPPAQVSFSPDLRTQSVRYTDSAKWVLDGTQPASITALDVDESQPTLENAKECRAVPVVVAVAYETEREAHAFSEHARKRVPRDVSKWDVSAFDKTVRATVAVGDGAKGEMKSIDLAMKVFLDVLYSFPDAKYKSLTYTVLPYKGASFWCLFRVWDQALT